MHRAGRRTINRRIIRKTGNSINNMAAGNRKKVTKNEKRWSFSFFTDMAPEKKSNILKYSGIAVMVFAMFTFV
jgi:hypothetical protein